MRSKKLPRGPVRTAPSAAAPGPSPAGDRGLGRGGGRQINNPPNSFPGVSVSLPHNFFLCSLLISLLSSLPPAATSCSCPPVPPRTQGQWLPWRRFSPVQRLGGVTWKPGVFACRSGGGGGESEVKLLPRRCQRAGEALPRLPGTASGRRGGPGCAAGRAEGPPVSITAPGAGRREGKGRAEPGRAEPGVTLRMSGNQKGIAPFLRHRAAAGLRAAPARRGARWPRGLHVGVRCGSGAAGSPGRAGWEPWEAKPRATRAPNRT